MLDRVAVLDRGQGHRAATLPGRLKAAVDDCVRVELVWRHEPPLDDSTVGLLARSATIDGRRWSARLERERGPRRARSVDPGRGVRRARRLHRRHAEPGRRLPLAGRPATTTWSGCERARHDRARRVEPQCSPHRCSRRCRSSRPSRRLRPVSSGGCGSRGHRCCSSRRCSRSASSSCCAAWCIATMSPTSAAIVAGSTILVVAFVALNLLAQRFGALRASRGAGLLRRTAGVAGGGGARHGRVVRIVHRARRAADRGHRRLDLRPVVRAPVGGAARRRGCRGRAVGRRCAARALPAALGARHHRRPARHDRGPVPRHHRADPPAGGRSGASRARAGHPRRRRPGRLVAAAHRLDRCGDPAGGDPGRTAWSRWRSPAAPSVGRWTGERSLAGDGDAGLAALAGHP